MKKIADFIKSNAKQILEVAALFAVIILPWIVNLQELFKVYIESNSLTPDNLWWYFALTCGNPIASLILFCALLLVLRKINCDYVMNRCYVYHDYCYAWYWFCAKVLGIKKCNIILVPIQMQFKLVIRSTFAIYPLEDDDYPVIDNESECNVAKSHEDAGESTLNLILEDTYIIEEQQISKQNRDVLSIKISRNNGSNGRHFSQIFIDSIINVLQEYKWIPVVNVYATTNPKNTLNIARRAFGSISRGNVGHLYVFQQQHKEGIRLFERKGHKIF